MLDDTRKPNEKLAEATVSPKAEWLLFMSGPGPAITFTQEQVEALAQIANERISANGQPKSVKTFYPSGQASDILVYTSEEESQALAELIRERIEDNARKAELMKIETPRSYAEVLAEKRERCLRGETIVLPERYRGLTWRETREIGVSLRALATLETSCGIVHDPYADKAGAAVFLDMPPTPLSDQEWLGAASHYLQHHDSGAFRFAGEPDKSTDPPAFTGASACTDSPCDPAEFSEPD